MNLPRAVTICLTFSFYILYQALASAISLVNGTTNPCHSDGPCLRLLPFGSCSSSVVASSHGRSARLHSAQPLGLVSGGIPLAPKWLLQLLHHLMVTRIPTSALILFSYVSVWQGQRKGFEAPLFAFLRNVKVYNKCHTVERNSVAPEVRIPLISAIEILIKSHSVVTIQGILTTSCYILKR